MRNFNNKGITIIALVITIIVTMILIATAVEIGTSQINKAKLEDLKTTMLLIKGRVQVIVEKNEFGDSFDDTGMLAYADATEYVANIPADLASQLVDTSNLYIWEQTAMDNNNIDVDITEEEFFIIDYNTKEIYYSLGFYYDHSLCYSLTELQGL